MLQLGELSLNLDLSQFAPKIIYFGKIFCSPVKRAKLFTEVLANLGGNFDSPAAIVLRKIVATFIFSTLVKEVLKSDRNFLYAKTH